MKRITAALTALTVVIGLGTSCQKEMENGQEIPGNGIGLKVTATIADNGTKVSYQEDGTDHSLQPTWQQNDTIIGFDGTGKTYAYKVTSVDGTTKKATLERITEGDEAVKGTATSDPADGTTMYMFYTPGTTPDKISNKSLTVSLANQAKDVVPALMMAQATVANGSLSLQFSNVTAIIGVKAPVMADKNKAYTSLALSGSAGLNTAVKFDLNGETLQASYQTSGTLTKTLDFTSDKNTGNGPDVIYIVACPADQQNLSFKFNGTEEYFNVENVAIAANNYYRLEAPSTEKQKFTVTVDNTIQNGTITTDPSGSVAWGTEVTVTATPNAGYELATLTYNDGESHNITDNKFTMPQKNVTVSGSFQEVPLFTVASGTKVSFAPGNLYAKKDGSTWKWGFYDKQYKFHSESMKKISSGGSRTAASGDTEIDLFCWGYSAYSTTPTANTTNSSFSDWGTSNLDLPSAPYSGGWRTLDNDQWTYLLNTRTSSTVGSTANARYLKCKVTVNSTDIPGLMIFPDIFTWPTEVGDAPTVNNNTTAWNSVPVYTTDQFTALEAAGVVFLPAAGDRQLYGNVINVGSVGFYWSSMATVNKDNAFTMAFGISVVYPAASYPREHGRSVRLVSVVQ